MRPAQQLAAPRGFLVATVHAGRGGLVHLVAQGAVNAVCGQQVHQGTNLAFGRPCTMCANRAGVQFVTTRGGAERR